MIEIGKFNALAIVKRLADDVYLDGGELGEILLAAQDVTDACQAGQTVNAFVYVDGKNRYVATTQTPKAQVDDVAWLKVVSLSHAGAFLDWGLPKDLLVPFSEQKTRMVEGRFYLVKVFLDESNRIAASTILDDFIQDQAVYLKEGEQVELMIADTTELGVKAVINNRYWGVLYKNELFQPVSKGQKLTGYIKKIRPDHKIDLTLDAGRYGEKVDSVSERIVKHLQQHGGRSPLTDKSPPELIYDTFGVSKKVFKQAIGGLYKRRKIRIDEDGIELVL